MGARPDARGIAPQHAAAIMKPANGAWSPRVLVLARAFPNTALPGQGLWVARLVQAATPIAAPVVISAIPRVVPGIPIPEWRELRRVPSRADRNGVEVIYPRVPGGLVHFTHALDARLALPSVRRA